jgi:hypothetical protein
MAHSSMESLEHKVRTAQEQVLIGATYQHYKTRGFYKVLHIALQEATEEPCVVYENSVGLIWVRNLDDWLAMVRDDDGRLVPRFEKQ